MGLSRWLRFCLFACRPEAHPKWRGSPARLLPSNPSPPQPRKTTTGNKTRTQRAHRRNLVRRHAVPPTGAANTRSANHRKQEYGPPEANPKARLGNTAPERPEPSAARQIEPSVFIFRVIRAVPQQDSGPQIFDESMPNRGA